LKSYLGTILKIALSKGYIDWTPIEKRSFMETINCIVVLLSTWKSKPKRCIY